MLSNDKETDVPSGVENCLFFSSLVPIQTKLDPLEEYVETSKGRRSLTLRERRQMESRENDFPPIEPEEESFRHSGWKENRAKVVEIMRKCNLPKNRVDRFINCGSGAVVEVSEDGMRHRLRASYCGDRWCLPCSNAKAAAAARALVSAASGLDCREIVLTLRTDGRTLTERLDRLLKSFVKLRAQVWWQSRVDGGAYFVEITRGAKGDHWHVHLHAVLCGRRFRHKQLKEAWLGVTGDSDVVWISPIEDVKEKLHYACKYASKGFDASVLLDQNAAMECMLALRGRRLLGTFGCWRCLKLDDELEPEKGWRVVGRFRSIVNQALAGELWAIGVLLSLRCKVSLVEGKVQFDRIESG